MTNTDLFDNLLSRRGRLEHPWSTVTPPPEGTISFGGGIPDYATLPLRELQEAANHVFVDQGVGALQYGGSYGDITLREEIAARTTARLGVATSPEEVVITTGSSQALDILCATFVDPGDAVITEDPTFTGSLWTFRAHGARLVAVPIDRDGMDTDALEERLKELHSAGVQPKLIYLTPDFQNPTGTQLSEPRRRRLLELAEEYGCLVVEDTADDEIVIEGEPPPSLLSLAPHRVVQMSTFSKTVGPGLRIGWLTGAREVITHAGLGRTDMGSSVTMSRILAQFLHDGALDPHLARMREVYRTKRDAFDRAVRESLGGLATWDVPKGGFFFWLRAQEGIDVPRLWEVAREERIGFVPGFRFLVDTDQQSQGMRLAFSQVSLEEIPEGIKRLGRAFERLSS